MAHRNRNSGRRKRLWRTTAGLVLAVGVVAGLGTSLPGCASRSEIHPHKGAYAPGDYRAVLLEAQFKRDVAAVEPWIRVGSPEIRRLAVRTLGRIGGDAAAVKAAEFLSDDDASVREAAAFAVGASGSDRAPSLLETNWPTTVERDTTRLAGAAAMGLGYCKAKAAEALLIAFASRPDRPVEAPAALFNYYRWSGNDVPKVIPKGRLFAYLNHPEAAGRAGLGWLGRSIKDPGLLIPLMRLANDRDPEVRRAAALALADGRKNEKEPEKSTTRPAANAARAQMALRDLLRDDDPRVVIAAIRALASYGDSEARLHILPSLSHHDFNVRAAAAQSFGKLPSDQAPKDLTAAFAAQVPGQLVARIEKDSSPSVRFEAASALAKVAPQGRRNLIEALLTSELEYDRVAAITLVAADPSDGATRQLAGIADEDAHVRVRHTALGALEGRQGKMVTNALKWALADEDPVVVAVACGVVAANKLAELYPLIPKVTAAHPTVLGADAREGAITALATLKRPADRKWFSSFLGDPVPGVRWAAVQALHALDTPDVPEGAKPPKKSDTPPAPDPQDEQHRARLQELDPASAAMIRRLTPQSRLVFVTDAGRFSVALRVDEAPLHCAHVASLAAKGFYDGLTWHRVVPDFVIQGGCPRGDGSGSSGVTMPIEPTRLPYRRGTLGMPRSSHPDSGGCQLFICHSRAPHLDLHYTAFGQVVAGFDVVDSVDVDDVIRSVRVEGLR